MITFSLLKDSLRDSLKKTNTKMKPTYIKLFNIELMIAATPYSAFTYSKESVNELEIQIGKLNIIISTH